MATEPEAVEKFSRRIRESVASGAIPFCKVYIQSVIDRIEVGEGVVRTVDDKAALEQAVAGRVTTFGGVRRHQGRWRAAQDKTANTYMIEISM